MVCIRLLYGELGYPVAGHFVQLLGWATISPVAVRCTC